MDTDIHLAGALSHIAQELHFSAEGSGMDAWINALGARINHLIVHDFQGLVAVLYRLDVSESKLKQVLKEEPGADAGRLIALAMVERQLQKIKTRQEFRRDDDIAENERW